MNFPKDFIWGTATSAYQIEGAYNRDGKGVSIWDTFCHTPGKINDNETGDIACDHYDKYEDDIKLMTELGISAYRFSISFLIRPRACTCALLFAECTTTFGTGV